MARKELEEEPELIAGYWVRISGDWAEAWYGKGHPSYLLLLNQMQERGFIFNHKLDKISTIFKRAKPE
jgi:hypothetical protein